MATSRLHRSSTVESYTEAFDLFGVANYLNAVSIVVLVLVWTRAVPRSAVVVWVAASVVVGVLQLAVPTGLLTGEIDELRTVQLLGEEFVVHVASRSAWRPLLDVWLVASLGLMVYALARGLRRGHRAESLIVSTAMVIGPAFGVWDNFVDLGDVDTPYLAPLGLVIISIGGATYLADRNARAEQRLHDQSVQLEETVIARTAALIDSKHRLEAELDRQRRSSRNLADLAEQFETTNALVGTDLDAVHASMGEMVERLGTIMSASAVDLRIDKGEFARVVPRALEWRAPDLPAGTGSDAPSAAEPIRIGREQIGELRAWSGGRTATTQEELRYMDLAAEHLSGLLQRLELVGQIADSAVEVERRRIAMDIHDSVTQRLYSVSFLADAIAHLAEDDPAAVVEPVTRMRELVLLSISELRSLLFELRPSAFEDVELAELLGQLADSVSSSSTLDVVTEAQAGCPSRPMSRSGCTGSHRRRSATQPVTAAPTTSAFASCKPAI